MSPSLTIDPPSLDAICVAGGTPSKSGPEGLGGLGARRFLCRRCICRSLRCIPPPSPTPPMGVEFRASLLRGAVSGLTGCGGVEQEPSGRPAPCTGSAGSIHPKNPRTAGSGQAPADATSGFAQPAGLQRRPAQPRRPGRSDSGSWRPPGQNRRPAGKVWRLRPQPGATNRSQSGMAGLGCQLFGGSICFRRRGVQGPTSAGGQDPRFRLRAQQRECSRTGSYLSASPRSSRPNQLSNPPACAVRPSSVTRPLARFEIGQTPASSRSRASPLSQQQQLGMSPNFGFSPAPGRPAKPAAARFGLLMTSEG